MTINFTLFVQMFHFIVAYLIITKLLLKPALSIIQNDKKTEDEFLNLIKSKSVEIETKELLQKSLLSQSLEFFEKNKPQLLESKLSVKWQIPKASTLTNEDILNLKKDATNFIINRLKNVPH